MGCDLMSLEDDILQSQQELLAKAQSPQPFIGRVVSADPDPLQVVVEGTSVPLPAFSFSSDVLAPGLQVAVLPIGPRYIVLGSLGTAVAPTPDPVTEVDAWLAADTNYGTSLTNILTLAIPTAGTWRLNGYAGWHLVGATNQFSNLNFTGTLTSYAVDFLRFSQAANVGDFQYVLGTDENMGQTTPQVTEWKGHLVVSAPGNVTLGFYRTAGTSGTVHAGAYLHADLLS